MFRRLIGHDNDVQDLGWSYDSSILVSVGLDSKIVVWSGHTFEKLKTLSNHQSHVKGITFDPANKYFATASDDRTIKVFRFTPPSANSSMHDQINNFLIETTIVKPFVGSPLTTYFRRCSWSPDAAHIAAANAVNGPVSSVVIINRGSWDYPINLIGHEGPVEVCSFSPRLYDHDPPQPSDQPPAPQRTPFVALVACAGQDKALSVWTTGEARPLVVLYDLAFKTISDLAWGPDGKSLYATSLDGSIVAISFRSDELGRIVDLEENEKSLAKYGASRRGAGMVEGPVGLLLEEQSRAGEITVAEGRMGELMGPGAEGGQREPEQPANGEGHVTSVVTTTTTGTKSGASEKAPRLLPAPDGHHVQTNGQVSVDEHPVREKNQQQNSNAAQLEKLKQRVTITKDGKKRITPLLISGSSGMAQTSLPKPQLVAASSQRQASKKVSKARLDLSSPYDKLPRGGLAALLLGSRRRLAALEGFEENAIEKRISNASRDGAIPILTNGVDGLAPSGTSPDLELDPKPEFIRPALVSPSLSVSQIRLAVPKVRSRVLYTLGSDSERDAPSGQTNGSNGVSEAVPHSRLPTKDVFEVRNPGPLVPGHLLERNPARIVVSHEGHIVWQDFLLKSVLLATGTPNFWAAACEEGSIYVWTPAGRRMLNSMIVEAQPVIFDSKDWWLLCLTAVGMCHVWNLKSLSSPHPPVSLAPVLNLATHVLRSNPPHLLHGPAVTSARLSSQGRVIITLNNGDGYTYSPEMFAWQRLSEAWWAVGSQYWNSTDSSASSLQVSGAPNGQTGSGSDDAPSNTSAGIIPYLERRTTKEVLVRQRGFQLQKLVRSLFSREGFEGFESTLSVAHLENRIAAALLLGAKDDFRSNLYMYAKRVGAEGLKPKVEELLTALLGGVFRDAVDTADGITGRSEVVGRGWESQGEELCSWDRRELLKGVVLILGRPDRLRLWPR